MSSGARELLARASYGRLLAILSSRTRDLAAAEDALSEAFIAALEQWPREGAPAQPDAWLLTAARRRLIDAQRRGQVRERAAEDVADVLRELAEQVTDGVLPDERLRLLFVCTHPAIDPLAQVPLMLQCVLGLDAALIASAMRVAPKTMGQRLWRAKTKIRDAAVPFEVPAAAQLPERLEAVLEAIYAAYGTAWEDVVGADPRLRGLADEAIFLGRLLVERLPDEPEPRGLLALMLFAEARRAARRTEEGAYVPLEAQDQSRWSLPMMVEAEDLLRAAFQLGRVGPLQLEAAIQSAHVVGARSGRVNHAAIATLYEGLARLVPSIGVRVGHAAALIAAEGPEASLAALDGIEGGLSHEYQPYWAVRADALRVAGRKAEAERAYARAMALTEDPGTRAFLERRRLSL